MNDHVHCKHKTRVLHLTGDDPPRDRTSELRVLGFPSRHLGPIQITTDTALGVTNLVVEDKGTPLRLGIMFARDGC